MPIRGGGFPPLHMDLAPSRRMEPPPWSLALDGHYCIMVRVLLTHRIQVRECDHSLMAGSPRNRRMSESNYFDQRFLLVAESTQIGITLRLPVWLARECRRPRGKHSAWPRDRVLARPHVRRSRPLSNVGAVLEWDQATSIAALQMVFEKGERILAVSVIGRSHRLVIEIDDPFVLFGINRGFPRQG
jgi:hypothetical protein